MWVIRRGLVPCPRSVIRIASIKPGRDCCMMSSTISVIEMKSDLMSAQLETEDCCSRIDNTPDKLDETIEPFNTFWHRR